jgi:MFS family permease
MPSPEGDRPAAGDGANAHQQGELPRGPRAACAVPESRARALAEPQSGCRPAKRHQGQPRGRPALAIARPHWLNRGVVAIGGASFFADLGYEIPTSLLPAFLTSTLRAPAAALGVIEGLADGLAGVAKLAGGALADDPERRRATAIGGYTATAVLTALIGTATAVWQVGALRVAGWVARGLRGPARSALLADVAPPDAYGRAYGLERAMDNLGAIGGPLLALGLVAVVGIRTAILLSVIPGLLAAGAILLAIKAAPKLEEHERRPLRIRVRPVLQGKLGRLLYGITAFEVGNAAATLLILRATDELSPGHGHGAAVKLGLGLYAGYNLAAAVASLPAGRLHDRRGSVVVLSLGVAAFLVAYAGFALTGGTLALLVALFLLAGAGKGLVETAEQAAVAALAPVDLRGSAFGVLAAIQSFGNLAASATAGALWTLVSARAAFLYLSAWMLVSLVALSRARVR